MTQLTATGSPFEIGERLVRGAKLRVYVNAPAAMRDIWAATEVHGDAPFFVYAGERTTFAEAHVRVRSLAAHLLAAGIGKGDRVAIGMRNYPEWPIAFWACQSIGAITVSLNAWWLAHELEYALSDSGATALLIDGERYERLAELLARLTMKTVVVARGEVHGSNAQLWADVVFDTDPGPLPAVEIDPDDDATILYTSGTTGAPKGAVGSNRNHITNLFNTLLGGAIAMAGAPAPEPGAAPVAPPRGVGLCTFPFFHIGGLTTMYVINATGGCLVTQYKWDVDEALDLIEREKITAIAGVPTVVRALLEHPDAPNRDLSSLASIAQGGSPVPPDSIARIESEFAGKVSPGNGYGLTETTSAVIANTGAAYFAHKNSVGLPVPVCEAAVFDEAGVRLGIGEVGELLVRGPNNVRGYWNKPEATAEAFTDGWFHTGDAARIDADGYVYVVDRIKDVVLRGGENVYSAEVEAAIFEHPDISDVAIIGVPHQSLGEEVTAVIIVKPGASLTAGELQSFVAERLARFKVPSIVVFSDEPLPRNATGKVLKKDLRAKYLNGS
ncbi:MAG: class I adenylate-forming enzyme family protein [Ilumatobacteraceae bacterium]